MSNDTYRALMEHQANDKAKELGIKDTEGFAVRVNDLLMDPYDLNRDEIEAGITDGSGDGQIDAFYVLVNGHSMNEEDMEQKSIPAKGPLDVEIIMIQSKMTPSFEENVLKSIRGTIADLLPLAKDYSTPLTNYSAGLQQRFAIARYVIQATNGRTATIRARVFYATTGSSENPHANVEAMRQSLRGELLSASSATSADVVFLGAQELVDISRQTQTKIHELVVFDLFSSETGDSMACLVSMEAFMNFLNDGKGQILRGLFDANVRDFLGQTDVNEDIRETLSEIGTNDFWWFNNGITLVANSVDQKGKTLALNAPLLVNGLQTTNVIHAFLTDPDVDGMKKATVLTKRILVKIIIPPSEAVRDGVIRATNNQANIPKTYLRGMDKVQRNIEDHLKSIGLYYERRKNHYKNLGMARESIVTLTEMSQSLLAAILFRGADARGRPTTHIRNDEDYQQLFSESYSLQMYANIINAKREIISQLFFYDGGAGFRNNVVWHALAYISAKRFKNPKHAAQGWASLKLTPEEIGEDISVVVDHFTSSGGYDGIAKSPDFQDFITALARGEVVFGTADNLDDIPF